MWKINLELRMQNLKFQILDIVRFIFPVNSFQNRRIVKRNFYIRLKLSQLRSMLSFYTPQGGKTKLIFENLIFPQRDFVCWWNLHVSKFDHLNHFMTSGKKRSYILKGTCSLYMQVCLSMYEFLLHPARKG